MTTQSLSDFVADLAQRHRDTPAVIAETGTVTFGELDTRARRVAGGLARRGLGAGDRIALWLPTSIDYLVLCFAAWRLGAVVVSVNTRYQASELTHILAGTRPRMLALWSGFASADFPAILGRAEPAALASIECLLVDGAPFRAPPALRGAATVAISALAEDMEDDRSPAPADSPCVIFTTSGTTRAPKFVLHGQRGIVHHVRDAARAMGFDAPDAMTLQALPLCAVFGFTQALAALAGGRPQVSMALFEPAEAGRLVRRHAVTHCMGTDDMLLRMLEADPAPKPFPSLRLCGFGAFNPALADFLDKADRRGLPLIGLYGMSELLALFSARCRAAPPERRTLGGGLPVSPEAKVRARDAETGGILPPGRAGLLEMKGPSLMLGYYGDETASREAFTEDGWLRTGDIGWTEPGGGFAYLTRDGDVLRLGGFLVAPAEIEAALERHPDIAGVQVVGALAAARACAVAFVLLRDGARFDEDGVRRWCRERLAHYKVPQRIVALGAFPVTLSGNGTKIQRQKLREMAQALFS